MHFHGTPISPRAELMKLAGRNFCVSFAAPQDVAVCHQIGQSVMLDNGAFSFWRKGTTTDWPGYYDWCSEWLEHRTTWAVIPDVIDGDAAENDRLISEWPFGTRGAPVWHMHESIERLMDLASSWPRVCIGSSGQFAVLGTRQWHHRMEAAFNALADDGRLTVDVHMLRGMAYSGGPYPFASVDSTDVARNHNRPQNTAAEMAMRWDAMQPPARWEFRDQLSMEAA